MASLLKEGDSNLAYRHEIKYLINQADFINLRLRLSKVMKRDQHINTDGVYTVRSLYFDDYFNSAYNEKYMGALNRQKFRIRTYNHSNEVINLERKIKWANYIDKQLAKLSVSEVENIVAGDPVDLLKTPYALHKVFYYEWRTKVMRPRVIIDYEREPYILEAGNVRITFDQNVRAGMGSMDLFDSHLPTISVLKPGMVILEVKYQDFLPSIIRNLLSLDAVDMLSLSKYIMGCDLTIHKRASND